jgi:hypothetical protein
MGRRNTEFPVRKDDFLGWSYKGHGEALKYFLGII